MSSTTLDAPQRMKSRRQALDLVAALPELGEGDTVVIDVKSGSRLSTSFLDQLISALVVDRAIVLRFVGLSPEMVATARLSAESLGIPGRVFFADAA